MMLPMQNFLIFPVLLFGFETLPGEAVGHAESTPNEVALEAAFPVHGDCLFVSLGVFSDSENDWHVTPVPSHTTRIGGRAFGHL